MTDFVLKTKTERQLYVEALFHCFDQKTLSEDQIIKDLEAILPTFEIGGTQSELQDNLVRRVRGTLAAYKSGGTDFAAGVGAVTAVLNDLFPPEPF